MCTACKPFVDLAMSLPGTSLEVRATQESNQSAPPLTEDPSEGICVHSDSFLWLTPIWAIADIVIKLQQHEHNIPSFYSCKCFLTIHKRVKGDLQDACFPLLHIFQVAEMGTTPCQTCGKKGRGLQVTLNQKTVSLGGKSKSQRTILWPTVWQLPSRMELESKAFAS